MLPASPPAATSVTAWVLRRCRFTRSRLWTKPRNISQGRGSRSVKCPFLAQLAFCNFKKSQFSEIANYLIFHFFAIFEIRSSTQGQLFQILKQVLKIAAVRTTCTGGAFYSQIDRRRYPFDNKTHRIQHPGKAPKSADFPGGKALAKREIETIPV